MQRQCEANLQKRVLTVPANAVAHLFRTPAFRSEPGTVGFVIGEIARRGRFVDRRWAEAHDSVKQVIVYAAVRNRNNILCLRRSKNSNRAALRLRYSVLLGGHVDGTEEDSETALVDCLTREIEEEIGMVCAEPPKLLGVVVDPTTRSGSLHLGVIYEAKIAVGEVAMQPYLDNGEFVNSRRSNKHSLVGWDVLKKFAGRFDPWSELFLCSEVARRMLADRNAGFPEQKFFSFFH